MLLRKILGGPGNYKPAYKGVKLGSFPSLAQANAALDGAQLMHESMTTPKKPPKQTREDFSAPEVLAKGIYRRGKRFMVGSPRYLGLFATYAEALQAQADAPRVRKSQDNTADFESRTLKLE